VIQLWAFGKPRIIKPNVKYGEKPNMISNLMLFMLIVELTSLFKIMPFTGTETKTNHKNE